MASCTWSTAEIAKPNAPPPVLVHSWYNAERPHLARAAAQCSQRPLPQASAGLTPREPRRALLGERRQALQPVFGGKHCLVEPLLEGQRFIEADAEALIDGVLCGCHRKGCVGGHLLSEPESDLQQPS